MYNATLSNRQLGQRLRRERERLEQDKSKRPKFTSDISVCSGGPEPVASSVAETICCETPSTLSTEILLQPEVMPTVLEEADDEQIGEHISEYRENINEGNFVICLRVTYVDELYSS